ncbi:permease [Aeromonas simiae]|uniref:permease n=1 Tax=Aeromonas simiae TaxID=218936 RepID=UPI0005A9685E|nr:permease [Aeromonas simiae]MDO2947226.1 permease [Aeromonas simiae]MDO2954819.1 permease [Aeromonas simiae]
MPPFTTLLQDAAQMFLLLFAELSLLFLLISAAINRLRQTIPDHRIQALLGARQGRGYLTAALLGAITPFCSCSTIPMLRGLLDAKAGFGPTLTFLFVSPLLNPIIVGLLWVTFGSQLTLLYVLVAAGTALIASLLLSQWGFERYVITTRSEPSSCCSPRPAMAAASPSATIRGLRPASGPILRPAKTACCAAPSPAPVSTASCCDTPAPVSTSGCCDAAAPVSTANCCDTPAPASTSGCCGTATSATPSPWRAALVEAWTQYRDLLPYLLLGVVVGAFIYGFIPADWIARHAGQDNPFAILVSAVIGIPLYIRAEAVIPLASVLLGKGMGSGAVMALIIGSAGASLTEIILLKSMFRTPMMLAFLSVILGMAILMGYLCQYLL